MGKYIFILIALIFFIGIFKSHGANRLIWFFFGAFFLQDRIILLESPTVISFHRFLIYTLALSQIFSQNNLYSEYKQFPLFKSFTILFLGMLCIGAFDGRHSILLSLYRIIDDFAQSFLILFICYLTFDKNTEWKKLIKSLLIASIILSAYGFYNFITRSNPYDAYITNLFNSFSPFDLYAQLVGGRFRVNSFASHPIYFGYLSGILFLIAFYAFFSIPKLKNLSLISIPFTFLSLILSNSRTPLVAFLIGLPLFILLGLDARRKITLSFYAILISIAVYNVSFFQEKIYATIDIFKTSESKTGGSSLEMRTTQLRASYIEFLKSPVFGNGLYYINENLGWGQDPDNLIRDEDFQGFESYIYHLLIEQGAVGILINLIFFSNLFIYFLRRRFLIKETATLGFSILIMFIIFICGTGTVDSWIISMGFLGILIKHIEQS